MLLFMRLRDKNVQSNMSKINDKVRYSFPLNFKTKIRKASF